MSRPRQYQTCLIDTVCFTNTSFLTYLPLEMRTCGYTFLSFSAQRAPSLLDDYAFIDSNIWKLGEI